ncbi:hypothetical protein ACTXT7_014691 [Hymenolepis weldensis]
MFVCEKISTNNPVTYIKTQFTESEAEVYLRRLNDLSISLSFSCSRYGFFRHPEQTTAIAFSAHQLLIPRP